MAEESTQNEPMVTNYCPMCEAQAAEIARLREALTEIYAYDPGDTMHAFSDATIRELVTTMGSIASRALAETGETK